MGYQATALVDTSVIRWMTRSTRYMVKRSIVFDGHEHSFHVPVVAQRNSPSGWKKEEVELLAGVVDYVKRQQLTLFSSTELMQEQLQAPQVGRGLPNDLLREVDFRHAKAPIERGRFGSLLADKYLKTEARQSFCVTLLNAFETGGLDRLALAVPLSKFELDSLRAFDRYAQLCLAIDEKHYVDAWHLWTAERNGLGYFLTLDKTFKNVMTQTARVDLPVRPVLPSELLNELRGEDHGGSQT